MNTASCSVIHLKHQTHECITSFSSAENSRVAKIIHIFECQKHISLAHQVLCTLNVIIVIVFSFLYLLSYICIKKYQLTPSGLKCVPALLQLKLTSPTAWTWSPCSPRLSPRTFPWILTCPVHCKAIYTNPMRYA